MGKKTYFDLGAGKSTHFKFEKPITVQEGDEVSVDLVFNADGTAIGKARHAVKAGEVVSVDIETASIEVVTDPTVPQDFVAAHGGRHAVKNYSRAFKTLNTLLFASIYGVPGRLFSGLEPKETDEPMPRSARDPRRPSRRYNEGDDPAVPPGKVCFSRGHGTYNARARLRALGGRWDQNLLGGCWVVPAEHGDSAEANIRLAERAGVELPLDDMPGETARITCYVCGTRYQPWEFAKMAGAVVADWYCGCEERRRGPAPRTATTRGAR